MKYVLFYTVNGLGLGHLTRRIAIARQLRIDEFFAEVTQQILIEPKVLEKLL